MLGAANPRRNGRTHRGLCLAAAAGLCMLGAVLVGARAAVVLTATTNPTDGTYLVTGIPASASHGLLKLVFTNLTAGTDLSLCACTPRQFHSRVCAIELGTASGADSSVLTIIDPASLAGQLVFVKRTFGTIPAKFTLSVE